MIANYVEEVLRSIDPAAIESEQAIRTREDEIWLSIMHSLEQGKPRRRVRRYELVGAAGAAVAAAAILIAALGAPTSAVAATLRAAATSDASAAALPPLAAGDYYYQESQVSLTCEVSSPSMPPGETPITYIANGTMQSWTTADGDGKVVITPSEVGGDGSHFATPGDEVHWVAAGEPVIPCALVNSSNQFGGNPANVNSGGALGGYSSTVSGYGGFGLSLAMASRATLLNATTSVNNLPSGAADISNLLANGQIGTDGTLAATPQVCPVLDGSSGTSLGCTPSEQLDVIEQLIQLPDASAKLGSVLYLVLSDLPGAELAGSVTTSNGSIGTVVEVPQGTNESFQVVLNPTTGALISCSEFLTQSGTTTSVGSVSYGSVQVVQGEGSTPASGGYS